MTDMFRQIAEAVDIRTVASDLGLSVNRAGYIYCPLHVEKTPSCKLYPEQGRFFCYGCHEHGDSVDLVVAVMGCTKTEAAILLNERYSLGFDLKRSATAKIRRKKPDLRKDDAEQVKQAVDTFADAARELRQHSKAPTELIKWLDDVHQEMLEDDELRLSDPVLFMEKWKGVFDRYADIVTKQNDRAERISRALYDARIAGGEYQYPEQTIRNILGRPNPF